MTFLHKAFELEKLILKKDESILNNSKGLRISQRHFEHSLKLCLTKTLPSHFLILCLEVAEVFLFVSQESFARAKNWVKELQRQASPNIVIALSGNKADLANKRAVDFQVC